MMSIENIDVSSRDLIPGPKQPLSGVVSEMDSGIKSRNDKIVLVWGVANV